MRGAAVVGVVGPCRAGVRPQAALCGAGGAVFCVRGRGLACEEVGGSAWRRGPHRRRRGA